MTDAMKRPVTLQQAIGYFSDADRAFRYAVEFRWPDARVNCPRCASDQHSFISTRKIWFCKGCKKQFTVKVGTIFEDSPIRTRQVDDGGVDDRHTLSPDFASRNTRRIPSSLCLCFAIS
jgi:hypothetical protein